MKAQYNFKIEDTLKQELDQLQEQSGVTGKEDFLSELLSGYKHCKANSVDTEIDLSKYETVSKQTKTIIFDAFKHILATIESNSTNNKQQALLLEKDSLAITDERKSFIEQINQLNALHNEKLLDVDKQNKEQLQLKDDNLTKVKSDIQNIEDSKDILSTQLSDAKKELSQVQSIAEQVQSITGTNKELRDELSELTTNHNQKLSDLDTQNKEQLLLKNDEIKKQVDQLKELDQINFKSELLSQNKDKELEQLKKQLEELKIETTNKDDRVRELEKENIVLSTKLDILKPKEDDS